MFLADVFNFILYQPLFNTLIFLYEYFPGRDFGVAVIILTLLIKIALYPLGSMGIRAQKNLSQLQPKVQELQEKHKNDKERLVKETLALYKKEKINPFSGLLPLLVQLPILIALFQVFWRGFGPERMVYLYGFLPNPGEINPFFLGLVNLSSPSIVLAIFAGAAQFLQTKMLSLPANSGQALSKKVDFSKMMQKQMLYFLPVLTILILWRLPSAVGLYWLVTSLFTIAQQYLILKSKSNA